MLDSNFSNNSIRIQPKLTINQPGDEYEQEADAMAHKVMRMPNDSLTEKATGQFSASAIQRKCKHCEDEEKVQRKEASPATPSIERAAGYVGSLSGGRSLSASERSFFEPRMGYDFSKVRLHTDSQANQSAKSINALAYTHGSNIVFNSGEYQSNTDKGKRLLAHELSHVVQQGTKLGKESYIQRQAALPTDLFSYPEEDRKQITITTDRVGTSVLPSTFVPLFATSRKVIGPDVTVLPTISAMGTVIFSSNIPQQSPNKNFNIRKGLEGIAEHLEKTSSVIKGINKSVTITLNITQFGGTNGNYRFTHFNHVDGKVTEEVTLIEQLSGTTAIPTVTEPSKDAQEGPFKVKGVDFVLVKGWTQEQKAFLDQALGQLLPTALTEVAGLTFERATDIADQKEGGYYEPKTHTIGIRDMVFGTLINTYSAGTETVRIILHEIGHAIDAVPLHKAKAAHDIDKKELPLKKATSLSRQKIKYNAKNNLTEEFEGKGDTISDFRTAVIADRKKKDVDLPISITKYGGENWQENFAEAYSLYIVDQALFEKLRPSTAAYFKSLKY